MVATGVVAFSRLANSNAATASGSSARRRRPLGVCPGNGKFEST